MSPGFPGCSKRYARKFRLHEHQKLEHGIENSLFSYQLDSEGRGASFRTNTELINHCEKLYDDLLG